MSFRDLRSLTEIMRALGYPRLISLENFRQPNFRLVSEMMNWLAKRFDQNADIDLGDIDTEQGRVNFVRSVVQFMALKAHIKLHSKKLYQADGYAVKEIIKVASVLYEAMKLNAGQSNKDLPEDDEDLDSSTTLGLSNLDISAQLSGLKQARMLGSQITSKGAALYDLLGKEVDLRERRHNVLARQLEVVEVEKAIRGAVRFTGEEIKEVTLNIENVASNEVSLDAKIDKKRVELERNQKRLTTLKKVRPAFMDEYERLEAELRKVYEEYVVRFRCLAYLEQQLEEQERADQERVEERLLNTRKIMERLKRSLDPGGARDRGDDEDDDDLEDLDDDDDLGQGGEDAGVDLDSDLEGDQTYKVKGQARHHHLGPRRGGARAPSRGARHGAMLARPGGDQQQVKVKGPGGNGNRKVFGTMTGGGGEDDDGDSGSLDSDSDLMLVGGQNDFSDEDDDDELEVNELAADALKSRKSARHGGQNPSAVTSGAMHSDDDDF